MGVTARVMSTSPCHLYAFTVGIQASRQLIGQSGAQVVMKLATVGVVMIFVAVLTCGIVM